MPKSNLAVFAQTLKTSSAVVTEAVPLTGAGGVGSDVPQGTRLLLTAGVEGALVTSVSVIARGTITATSVMLFIRKRNDDAAQRRLMDMIQLPGQTLSGTTKTFRYAFDIISQDSPLRLEAEDELYVGLTVAQSVGIAAHAAYTDF